MSEAIDAVQDDELTPADELRELLETLVEAMDLDGEVKVEETPSTLTGSVEGGDLGRFIGRHGTTIEAVQHLAQRIVQRGGGPQRVIVDAGGYRERREGVLRGLADAAVEEAVRSGREVALEPMGAAERRFVHEYLREGGEVATHSEGDEPERRLVVVPTAA